MVPMSFPEAPALPPAPSFPEAAEPAPQARPLTRRFATGRTIVALILREMSTSYGRSPGGYAWAILEPLGAILLLSAGFSLVARHPSLGTNFLLFYATGYLPFSLFQSTSNPVARSIIYSRALLMYPVVTWVDAVLARFLLNTLTALMVSYLLLTGILLIYDTGAVISVGPILMAMLMAALLGLGVGSTNCVLMGLFPTWSSVWSIFTRPLFLASGVLLLIDDLPRWVRDILWYNPLIHITGAMRRGFYPMYAADYVSYSYVLVVSLVLIALGVILLGRYHREILNDD